MRPRHLLRVPRGPFEGPGGPRGSEGVSTQGIPWCHLIGLMSLLMIHRAYMPVYISDPDFSCGRAGQPELAQEVLADLKMTNLAAVKLWEKLLL